MKKTLGVLILVFITAISCTTKYKNMKSFETVWQTINEKHFDPTFGGLDWSEVRDRYQTLITAAKNKEEYYLLINKMLFELNLSHIGVVPPDDLRQIDPILSAEGSIGIDVRMLGDNAVITSVKSDSNGAQARLVALDRHTLLQGKDSQLEAAIKFLSKKLKKIDYHHTRSET